VFYIFEVYSLYIEQLSDLDQESSRKWDPIDPDLDLSRATENREGREGNFLLAYS
jgi:hypothetical protein